MLFNSRDQNVERNHAAFGATRGRTLAALLCLVFAVSFNTTAQAQRDFSSTQIEAHSLLVPESQPMWREYFRWLGHQSDERISRDFRRLQAVLTSSDQEKKGNLEALLKMLHSIRPDLPLQLRWLLAAVEIKQGIVDFHTLADAQLALQFTDLRLEPKMALSGDKPSSTTDLLYRLPDTTGEAPRALRLDSLRSLVFLQRHWQRLPILVPAETIDDRLEQSRLLWLDAIRNMYHEQSHHSTLELLAEFAPPSMRHFSSRTNKDRFLELSTSILSDLSASFYKTKSPEWTQIQNLVRGWLSDDPVFFARKFSSLRLYRFVNLRDVLALPLTDNAQRELVDFLASNKGDPESFLISVLMLAKSQSTGIPSSEMHSWTKRAMQILLSGIMRYDRMSLATGALETITMSSSQFNDFIRAFYDVYTSGRPLDPDLARLLIERRTPRTDAMSDFEWSDLEWKRLECAEHGLTPEEFRASLVERMVTTRESDAYDGLLAGRYLNAKLPAADLETVATQFKKKMRGTVKDTASDAWAQNNAWMVKVTFALSPKDAELQAYLSSIYLSRRVDAPITPLDALDYLAKSGAAPVEVHDDLIRRLRFVGHGDTAGSFLALVKLFPDEGLEIIAIVHRHRSAPEKIKHLLRVLVSECESNPRLYDSIKRAVKTHPDKAIAEALYQGQPLHSWIKTKIEMRGGASIENQCRQLFSTPKGRSL